VSFPSELSVLRRSYADGYSLEAWADQLIEEIPEYQLHVGGRPVRSSVILSSGLHGIRLSYKRENVVGDDSCPLIAEDMVLVFLDVPAWNPSPKALALEGAVCDGNTADRGLIRKMQDSFDPYD
jgi:hypothetical protein